MLRPILLLLSQSKIAQKFVLNFPLAKRVARRYVAGETLQEALAVSQKLNQEGMQVALDLLGENVSTLEAATRFTTRYLDMLEQVQQSGVRCYISLKLTQLGLDQGQEVALNNLRTILSAAASKQLFVRIDMEGSYYTDATVAVFRQARQEFDNVGIVLQAYMRRSKSDVASVNRLQGQVRLCKGAYSEPPSVAYQSRREVTNNMLDLMADLMKEGNHPAIASHDEEVIQAALRFSKEYGISPDQFEFQMLYGIRRERQLELIRQGYQVRIYVPFGLDWYPYFMRRLAERPANLWFFLTALVRG